MNCKDPLCKRPAEKGRIYCHECQIICNEISMQRMINKEPLIEGNTLRENLGGFLKANAK